MTKIFFRADGNTETGLGHVYRSCALAETVNKNFDCVFVIKSPYSALKEEISKYCSEIIELNEELDLTEDASVLASLSSSVKSIVVLDGYKFDHSYQQTFREQSRSSLVCIDDIHQTHFVADAIINHSGIVSMDDYEASFYTQFFHGIKYALLREDFLSVATPVTTSSKNLLLCLGGSDPKNDTLQVLQQIPVPSGFDSIHILIGAGYKYRTALESYIGERGDNTQIHQNLPASAVVQLMQSCGHAIVSPSSVSYEYMSVGGVVYLHLIADNQKGIRAFFLKEGLAVDFSQFNKLSAHEETAMMKNQRKFFDKRSGERLLRIFENFALMANCSVTKASEAHLSVTYTWANDPLARQMSYNHNTIPFEDHQKWYSAKIKDESCLYCIFENDGEAFAQIRFDDRGSFYLLSYSIADAFRGKGLGSFIIAEGLKFLRNHIGKAAIVVGYVKQDNVASCLSFEKMKFLKEEINDYPNSFKYTIQL